VLHFNSTCSLINIYRKKIILRAIVSQFYVEFFLKLFLNFKGEIIENIIFLVQVTHNSLHSYQKLGKKQDYSQECVLEHTDGHKNEFYSQYSLNQNLCPKRQKIV
jgi:hypothetical protein